MDIPSPDDTLDRIQELIDTSFPNTYAFAKQSGIDNGNLSKKLKRQQPLTMKDINKICKNAHVSKDWLLNGNGEMFTSPPGIGQVWFIQSRIIDLARRLTENKEEITRMERENTDILAQLSALCSQLDITI